jgi:hypothetical protein
MFVLDYATQKVTCISNSLYNVKYCQEKSQSPYSG